MNKARAFNPFLCAATDNLKALIAEVQVQMSGYEFFHQTRKRARRPADQATYDRTVEAILCDLCVVEFEPNNDSIHLPLSNKVLRSKSRYKGTAVGKTLPDILKVMSAPEMDFAVIWPLYAKGCFGESAGLASSEMVSSSHSRHIRAAQHQSWRDFPKPKSPRH
jgi:hypothetical protein